MRPYFEVVAKALEGLASIFRAAWLGRREPVLVGF
jgi:hypothetical protein